MTDINLANLHLRRIAESRSLSAENPRGDKGRGGMALPLTESSERRASQGWPARDLGQGWKVRPCIDIEPGQAATIMDIEGPGVIRHIWVTVSEKAYRSLVLRVWWDGQDAPSVVCPLGDFFCNAWDSRQNVLAIPVNVNPSGGMNCYFTMPFARHARITVTNEGADTVEGFFYTINYTIEPVPPEALYFHAWWRRSNPLPFKEDFLIVDGIKGAGHYVGTFMAWEQTSHGWWGEGEIKMFIDGDGDFPTICGTGVEDYFGGAWCFITRSPAQQSMNPAEYDSSDYSAPFHGFQQVRGKNLSAGCRMTLYRFHAHDPVFFSSDLKVTIQALGWDFAEDGIKWRPLKDDIAAVSYWYQTLPHAPFPEFQALAERTVK